MATIPKGEGGLLCVPMVRVGCCAYQWWGWAVVTYQWEIQILYVDCSIMLSWILILYTWYSAKHVFSTYALHACFKELTKLNKFPDMGRHSSIMLNTLHVVACWNNQIHVCSVYQKLTVLGIYKRRYLWTPP